MLKLKLGVTEKILQSSSGEEFERSYSGCSLWKPADSLTAISAVTY